METISDYRSETIGICFNAWHCISVLKEAFIFQLSISQTTNCHIKRQYVRGHDCYWACRWSPGKWFNSSWFCFGRIRRKVTSTGRGMQSAGTNVFVHTGNRILPHRDSVSPHSQPCLSAQPTVFVRTEDHVHPHGRLCSSAQTTVFVRMDYCVHPHGQPWSSARTTVFTLLLHCYIALLIIP